MTITTTADLVRSVLTAAESDPEGGFALADDLARDADGPLTTLLAAAALAGGTLGSVLAAAAFTRERERPRPLPGLQRAVDDPFAQALLGLGLIEAQGAIALVIEASEAIGAPDAEARALAAFDVAAGVAQRQAEDVWEVVGTSGSASSHGFDALGRAVRRRAAQHPRAVRRRAIGQAHLARVTA